MTGADLRLAPDRGQRRWAIDVIHQRADFARLEPIREGRHLRRRQAAGNHLPRLLRFQSLQISGQQRGAGQAEPFRAVAGGAMLAIEIRAVAGHGAPGYADDREDQEKLAQLT